MNTKISLVVGRSFPWLVAVACAAGLGLALAGTQALAAVSDMSKSVYSLKMDPADLNAIQALLPEQTVNRAFVNSAVDPNLRLLEKAEVSLTFIDEGAGFRNSFGYFLFDADDNILETRTIFANASKVGGGGSLRPGDTVDLGVFDAGTNIGFWLQADGFKDPKGHTFYTLDHLNPDGLRHVAMIADIANERVILGVEDLYNLGDQDFNDIVFTFTASPFSAIDIAGMPTGAPEAGPIATALISASLFGAYARRRQARRGRAKHAGSVDDGNHSAG
jgi:hypothetical protein